MKSIKMLGVSMFAALALTAMVGAASASAGVTLCKVNSGEVACPVASQYPAKTTIAASLKSGTKATFSYEGMSSYFSCSGSTLKGSTNAQSGEPLTATFTSATLTGCLERGSRNCTATFVNLPYSATIDSAGTLAIGSSGKGAPTFLIACGSSPGCYYQFENWTSSIQGGNPATFAATEENELALVGGGAFCVPNLQLSATYTVTAPTPLYVGHS